MKKYNVRGSVLGFEDTINIEIHEIDELFSTMQDMDNKDISFTIINPYMLREYSFDLPTDIKVILGINETSNVSVYNIVIIQKPLEDSTINFLAPIIINNDNNKVAQAVLDSKRHPDFGMSETIKSFKEQ
ncbi:flagellar assembly protein FliW [Candidatus Sulfurimonas marisnigri]|uniref:Flagellar assembly factor FliW n=1 Tax=Candidatus Sulfurimonas marisnigri TaxID=2740405 RepID=A0A7S7M154_9BACT|nr:flagellar assembly protein FliW [Candidatus Sulfurimonas marisnigri]QOY54663.1 flagellar assembly protein FliW [Candidatus Sulfurimonas marisnigri]